MAQRGLSGLGSQRELLEGNDQNESPVSAQIVLMPLEKAKTGTIVCVKNTSEEAAEMKRC